VTCFNLNFFCRLLCKYTVCFKKVGLPVFDIPKQVLRLVYGECLIWWAVRLQAIILTTIRSRQTQLLQLQYAISELPLASSSKRGAHLWCLNEFKFHVNEISSSYERMSTKTRFEEGAKDNSKMAYWPYSDHSSQSQRTIRQYSEPVKTESNYMKLTQSAGKIMSRERVTISFGFTSDWLKKARVEYSMKRMVS